MPTWRSSICVHLTIPVFHFQFVMQKWKRKTDISDNFDNNFKLALLDKRRIFAKTDKFISKIINRSPMYWCKICRSVEWP